MSYNPNIHHRRSIRLKGYDYSQAGLYFITICCQDRICRFGQIENDEMILNEFGQIAYNEWGKLAERFRNFELDIFQIMPNHIHGIIVLNTVGAGFTPAQCDITLGDVAQCNIAQCDVAPNYADADIGAGASPAPTITTVGNIVGAYKSLVANRCLDIYKSKNEMMGKLWQRNYYENIIRNEQSYLTISNYIINNPAQWDDDKFHERSSRHSS